MGIKCWTASTIRGLHHTPTENEIVVVRYADHVAETAALREALEKLTSELKFYAKGPVNRTISYDYLRGLLKEARAALAVQP